jgi:hypothetical protein
MNKEEVIQLMLESMNADNRELCAKAGMSESDTETQIAQSQPTLIFMFGNIYDKLKANNAIA